MMIKKDFSKMSRNQRLGHPEYYMEKLDISFDEAVELMKADKEDKSPNKAYLNEESKKLVARKKAIQKATEGFKMKARKIAREVILKREKNIQFDNGSIRMDVEKILNEKVPHQTITAEFNAMVKEGLLEKEKVNNKNMFKLI